MDFSKPPLSTIVEVLRVNGLKILLIVVVALIAVRVTTVLVHGIVKTLLDREATEGTAQELSAIETTSPLLYWFSMRISAPLR